jgi:repressor LexA
MDAPRAPLTPIERKVYHFLIDYLAEHTFQPSVREIARHFRIPSTKTVTDLIAAIERKGYVRRSPGRSRGLVIEGFSGGAGTMPVPVVRIAPGPAMVAEDHVTVDRLFLPADDCYLVRAHIEDAPAHGVRAGDLLLVHPGGRAGEDAPVVARVGGAVLVRALERRGHTLVLRAPREGADDIELGPADDFEILGPLAGVLRLPVVRATDDLEKTRDARPDA